MSDGTWNKLLDQIKSQLEDNTQSGEYLQDFNIFEYNDADDNDLYLEYPYIMIGYLDIRDFYFISGETAAEIDIGFLFAINHNYMIDGINEVGDRLMGYILQQHKEFLRSMVLNTSNVTIITRGIAKTMRNQSDSQTTDIVYEGTCMWPIKVLDSPLWGDYMTSTILDGNIKFYLSGYRQLLVSSLSYDLKKDVEMIDVLDTKYSLPWGFIIRGNGDISYYLGDKDNGYGPTELLGSIFGYNDYNTTTEDWAVTEEDLTFNPITQKLARHYVYRNDVGVGSDISIDGDGSGATLTHTINGAYIDKIALKIKNKTGTDDIKVTANGHDVYIEHSDIVDDTKTWYTLKDGSGNESTIEIGSDTTIVVICENAADDCDICGTGTDPWFMVRSKDLNLLTIKVITYDTNNTNSVTYTFDHVIFTSSSVELGNDKSAIGKINFTFEGLTIE